MRALLFISFLTLVPLGLAQAQAPDLLAQQKEEYQIRTSQAKILHEAQMAELSFQYATALKGSAAMLQKEGNLDGLLAVKEEMERFERTRIVPAQPPRETHPTVVQLQNIYRDSKAKADNNRDRTLVELTQKYLTYLSDLQKKLTQDGQLEQALLVKAEAERVQEVSQDLPEPAVLEKPQENIAAAAKSTLIDWSMNRPRGLPPGCRLVHQGDNSSAKDGSLIMAGGRTLIEGLNEELLKACKASNQWSLVIELESHDLKQSGPARIASFSENSTLRNFSLCQEGDHLVLRLRTTKTGTNGNNPQVMLGKIQAGKAVQVALSYQPGVLLLGMDGKAIPVQQIEGDFSNWQPCQLLLGNEWKDDRAWKGSIRSFSLHSEALTEQQIRALTR